MSVKENGYNIFVVRGQYPVAKKEVKCYFEFINEQFHNSFLLFKKHNSCLRTLRASNVGLHLNKSNVQNKHYCYFHLFLIFFVYFLRNAGIVEKQENGFEYWWIR